MTQKPSLKKQIILEEALTIGDKRLTLAQVDAIQQRLVARTGPAGKASPDYIASVLKDAGFSVVPSARSDTGGRFEEEFRHLLRFSTFQEAEGCLARLGELLQRFRKEGEKAAIERVFETARRGRQRAEHIARDSRVDARKRAEKAEIANWFKVWLDIPDAFFDWLELRKQSQEFGENFGTTDEQR